MYQSQLLIVCVCLTLLLILKIMNINLNFRIRSNNILDTSSYKYDKVKYNIMFLMLCTSNYDHICTNGASYVYTYCKLHNYRFKIFRKNLNDKLHINFSKFEMVKQAMIDHPEIDYFVHIDADVVFTSYELSIEQLILEFSDTPSAKCFAPSDTLFSIVNIPYVSLGLCYSSMNAGFMIWRYDSLDIIERYLQTAEHTQCGKKFNSINPRNQNVWDMCFKDLLNKGDFSYIPWELVGTNNSKIIYQIYISHNKFGYDYVNHKHDLVDDVSEHIISNSSDVITLL